jgi:alpha-galactosidase
MTMKTIKITYIGGGSRYWVLNLMNDLALSTQLAGSLVLYDIDREAAQYNVSLADTIFSHPAATSRFTTSAEQSLARALKGADFVVISIEPGPTELRHADLEIPARYGILQTVGDTTGPGGLLRALRCISAYREMARAIMEHAPKAWVINYTNPMSVCTATLYREAPRIKAFGCCHEVFGTQQTLAQYVKDWFDTELPNRSDIQLNIAGVNHFTWATRANWQGHDLLPFVRRMVSDEKFFASRQAEARKAAAEQRWFDHHFLVASDLFRRFGVLGAAGDRHLAEFVPWYLGGGSEAELHRWGVVLTPYAWRLQRSKEPRPTADHQKELRSSGEEGVQQIEALLGLRALMTNVNLPNFGQMSGFPKHAMVETYAEFSHDNLRPMLADALPEGAACLVKRAVNEHTLTLEAGFNADPHTAFQALLTHPLVHLPTDRAWQMFSEMLAAAAPYLDQPEKWLRSAG